MVTPRNSYVDVSASEADLLSRVERSRVFEFAGAILFFACALIAGTAFLGWMMQADLRWAMALWLISAGILIGLLLVYGMFRVWGRIDGVDSDRASAVSVIYAPEPPAPPAPTSPAPALPAGNEAIAWQHAGRVEELPRVLIHGFYPKDLEYLGKYLAQGNKFSETAMEKFPLPYSGVRMGKAEGNTPYNRFMQLCVDRGIIVDRGGAGNPSGRLAITDETKIIELLKMTA